MNPSQESNGALAYLKVAVMLCILAGYAVGIGYSMAKINENERRITVLETQMRDSMLKSDAQNQFDDIKRRLDKLDDKLDQIGNRQRRSYQ